VNCTHSGNLAIFHRHTTIYIPIFIVLYQSFVYQAQRHFDGEKIIYNLSGAISVLVFAGDIDLRSHGNEADLENYNLPIAARMLRTCVAGTERVAAVRPYPSEQNRQAF
jgi:hypothetical protein